MNKFVMVKPGPNKVSSLYIAKITTQLLKSKGFNKEANRVAMKITGLTSVKDAYKITSRYIQWEVGVL